MLVRLNNPFKTFESFFNTRDSIDRLFDSFFNDSTRYVNNSRILRTSISDQKDSYLMYVEVPGCSKEDIKLSVKNDVITISAKREPEKIDEKTNVIRNERLFGEFERSFQLPSEVKVDKVEAEFKDGLLKVVLPKEDKALPKEITIK